jgi:hypothetical protein
LFRSYRFPSPPVFLLLSLSYSPPPVLPARFIDCKIVLII